VLLVTVWPLTHGFNHRASLGHPAAKTNVVPRHPGEPGRFALRLHAKWHAYNLRNYPTGGPRKPPAVGGWNVFPKWLRDRCRIPQSVAVGYCPALPWVR